MNKKERCQIPGCKNKSNMWYINKKICNDCWWKYSEGNKLKELLNLKTKEEKETDGQRQT